MTSKWLAYGLLLLVLFAAGGYLYLSNNDRVTSPAADIAAEQSDEQTSDTQQTVAGQDRIPAGALQNTNDQMLADLNRLVSTDLEIRRKALAELALELSKSPSRAEGKYSTYGNELLPFLNRVISDLNDPYAHDAVEATFYLSMVHQTRLSADSLGLDDATKQELDKLDHYPIPGDYAPMKDALIRTLTSSPNEKARHWAAMALANGFEPVQEIEGVLAKQFPLEEGSRKVQPAILSALSELASRNKLMRSTELAIIGGLSSSDKSAQRTAARVIETLKIDGGQERLIENIPAARDARTLRMMLDAVVSFGAAAEENLAELEKIARDTNEDERKKEILTTVDKLRNLGTR